MTVSSGSIEKLTIYAYSDEKYRTKVGEFKATINPNTITHTLATIYESAGVTDGDPDVSKKYVTIEAEKIAFDLHFDGTGVTDDGQGKDVGTQINNFYKLCYQYNGDIHKPNFLGLMWGTSIFKGRLTSCETEYKMFKANGAPLRAKLSVSFEQYIDPETLKKILKKSSPDMTHLREVKQGDTLPLMCKRIYGDSSYYLQVAEKNNLNAFRTLTPGMKLYFPPIKNN
jgi:nucleoid-associated protein YgaU